MEQSEMFEKVACHVCEKPVALSAEKCFSTIGRTNPLCSDYRCCRLGEKTNEQLNYVLSSTKRNVFLKACPGSGKTEVVGLKAAYEIKRWNSNPGGLAVLTFTNNAADVITRRVNQFAGVEKTKYPHFIGTIDSWLHGYIAHPFGHLITKYEGKNYDNSIRIIEERSNAYFLRKYKCDTPYYYFKSKTDETIRQTPLYANMLRYDLENKNWEFRASNTKSYQYIADDKYYANPAFSKFRNENNGKVPTLQSIKKDFKVVKRSFWKDGFATYQDIEMICLRVFSKVNGFTELCSRRFPIIIVDECQDLSWIQLQLLLKLKEVGTFLHFVGDLNQAIYEFKEVNPKKITEFINENCFDSLLLKANFRSGQFISDISQKIVEEASVCAREKECVKQPCVYVPYMKEDISNLPDWFERHLRESKIDVEKSAILARGWTSVGKLRPSGTYLVDNYLKRFSMAIYLWESGSIQSIEDSLKYVGHFFAEKFFSKSHCNPRNYYCPEFVKSSIRWRLFLAKVLDSLQKEHPKTFDLYQSCEDWAYCVRENFDEIALQALPILETIPPSYFRSFVLDGRKFKISEKDKMKKVLEIIPIHKTNSSSIRITTIHNVKGETFDAIMLVSSPTKGSKGSHWKEWLADPHSEFARFAYVASSRPKYLLVWAIPEPSKEDKKLLENLGFSISST